MRILLSLIAGLMLSLLSLCSLAEQRVDSGDYQVHYNALLSTLIPAQVAQQYGLTRSANQGLINISVLHNPDGQPHPVRAQITGKLSNLIGHSQQLEFIEVIEPDAIYYLAQFKFRNEEHKRFQLSVRPHDSSTPISVHWDKRFYTH